MTVSEKLRGIFADTRPLKSPHYRRLWTANIITVIGAQLTVVAVPAQIYDITGSSGMVGIAGLFGLVPLIIFGLWGGALADHFDRRRLLMVSTTGLIVTSALFWLQTAVDLNNVWALLVIFSVQQAFFAMNQPARTSILPQIVPIEQLPAANSLNMTVVSAGAIAGPLVGGALIPIMGYEMLYLVDTITLFATFYAVFKLPALPAHGRTEKVPGLRSVIEGFQYLRLHHIVLISFVVDLIAMIFGMPRALFPEIAHVSFGGSPEGGMELALLYAGMPIGAVIGGMLGGWISRIRFYGRAVLISIFIWGLAMFLLGIAFEFAPELRMIMLVAAVCALAVGGAADMSSAAFRQSILLGETSDAVRGRLQGVFIVVVAGGPRLADVLHGGVAEFIGPEATTWLGGLLVMVGMVLCAVLFPKFRQFSVGESVNQD